MPKTLSAMVIMMPHPYNTPILFFFFLTKLGVDDCNACLGGKIDRFCQLLWSWVHTLAAEFWGIQRKVRHGIYSRLGEYCFAFTLLSIIFMLFTGLYFLLYMAFDV